MSALNNLRRFVGAVFLMRPPPSQPDWVRARLLSKQVRDEVHVSFVGGPLDGWSDRIQTDVNDTSQDLLTLPVSEGLVQGMRDESPGPPNPVTSIAFYSVEKQNGRWTYHYRGSQKSQFLAASFPPKMDAPAHESEGFTGGYRW